ncbi:hypothetical protein LOTGIDRAFT_114833 [Lottia gigantea]|uniref:vitamin-K-epoxide reductase (warfarin-sensitive) n=1 Tax=Lottia gigantea TaxID=225164 RepID=V4AR60_LOTGI|nr:hypothetical protein LOTGIDRAFT_114833 [Lottia gigantea]ESO97315.1 hypothetical protein LOTGIDRAFT_114833 [Lottia gigantea]
MDRVILNIIGMVISLYSLRVEIKKEKDPTYVAACDFNDHMSCSKVLTSKYAKGFGIMGVLFGKEHFMNQRNCNLGLVFYLLQLALVFQPYPVLASKVLFYSSIVCIIGCVYLAIVLFCILKDVCVVCIATYFVNGALLYLNYSLYKNVNSVF